MDTDKKRYRFKSTRKGEVIQIGTPCLNNFTELASDWKWHNADRYEAEDFLRELK